MNISNISNFVCSFANDPTLEIKEKALKGAEILCQDLETMDASFTEYFDSTNPTDRWIISDFRFYMDILKDLGTTMKHYVTPFKLPLDMKDSVVQKRLLAGKKLSSEQSYLNLCDANSSCVKKLISLFDKLKSNYDAQILEKAKELNLYHPAIAQLDPDAQANPDVPHYYHETRYGNMSTYSKAVMTVRIGNDLEVRQKWVQRSKETLEMLDQKINELLAKKNTG